MKKSLIIPIAVVLIIVGCASYNQKSTFYPTLIAINTNEAATIRVELTKISLDNTTPVPPSVINAETWLQQWLSSPTCQPPCWENITPGKTTFSEVVKVVANIPGVSINRLSMTPALIDNNTAIRWDFGKNGSGSIRANFINKIVTVVVLVPDGDQILTVKDLITAYGHPDAIVTGYCFGEYFTVSCPYVLLYKKLGLVAYLDVYAEKSIIIKPDTQIVFVNLSPQNDLKIFDNENARLFEIPWDGYKTYKIQR